MLLNFINVSIGFLPVGMHVSLLCSVCLHATFIAIEFVLMSLNKVWHNQPFSIGSQIFGALVNKFIQIQVYIVWILPEDQGVILSTWSVIELLSMHTSILFILYPLVFNVVFDHGDHIATGKRGGGEMGGGKG
jgi:hypothetical protein